MRIIVLLLFISIAAKAQDIKSVTKNYKLLVNDGFSEKSMASYNFNDSSQWVITQNGKPGKDLKCLGGKGELAKAIKPAEIALLNDLELNHFVMEFNFIQRGRDFTLRDVCVIFGYIDNDNYMFAQAASEQGRYTHNIFAVENGKTQKIGSHLTPGVVWQYEKWHRVSLVRDNNGTKLYIDNEPVVETTNTNAAIGKIGIGTYGSEFKIDNLKVWSPVNH